MLYQNEKGKDLKEYLADWPAAYYKEEDAYDRKDMLSFAEENHIEDEELAIRRLIWEKRYEEKKDGNFPIDRCVRGLVIGKTLKNSSSNFFGFGAKRNQKLLQDVMKDLLLDQYQDADEATKDVLRQEWKQLAALYFKLCVEDKNFSTGILSMFKLSDEELLNKVADEVALICYEIPMIMNAEKEFEPLKEIFTESYVDTFRNGEKILTPKIEKIRNGIQKSDNK